ncbi:MAG: hypothetical protein ABJC33_12165 [Betaproteobacteria bacterium]
MNRILLFCTLGFLLQVMGGYTAAAAFAAEDPESVVLAENRFARLTLADYNAELQRLPENLRFDFATSPKRIAALLDTVLLRKSLAAQARSSGIEPAPPAQQTPAEADQALALLYIQRIENDAGADFDAKADQFTARARELYLLDRNKHGQRTFEEDKAEIIKEIRTQHIKDVRDAKLTALSSDPTTRTNQSAIDALVTRPPR